MAHLIFSLVWEVLFLATSTFAGDGTDGGRPPVFSRAGSCPHLNGISFPEAETSGTWYTTHYKTPFSWEGGPPGCIKTEWNINPNGTFVCDVLWKEQGKEQIIHSTDVMDLMPGESGRYVVISDFTPPETDPWYPYSRASVKEMSVLAVQPDSHAVTVDCYGDGTNHELLVYVSSRQVTLPDGKLDEVKNILQQNGVDVDLSTVNNFC